MGFCTVEGGFLAAEREATGEGDFGRTREKGSRKKSTMMLLTNDADDEGEQRSESGASIGIRGQDRTKWHVQVPPTCARPKDQVEGGGSRNTGWRSERRENRNEPGP